MTKDERAFHLAHHQTAAEHHTQLATCMKSMADFHRKMGEHTELSDRTAAEMHKAACNHCTEMAGHHANLAAAHLEMHKSLGSLETAEIQSHGGTSHDVKALCDRLDKILDGVVPTQVSAIPRFGSPDPRTRETVSKVDPSLKHLVSDETEARV